MKYPYIQNNSEIILGSFFNLRKGRQRKIKDFKQKKVNEIE
jgi:hypothetical protein